MKVTDLGRLKRNLDSGPIVVELTRTEADALVLVLDSFLDAIEQAGGSPAYAREERFARVLLDKLPSNAPTPIRKDDP